MKVIENNINHKYKLFFIPGWNCTSSSLEIFYNFFKNNYKCYLLTLSGFDQELTKEYKISNYLEEIESLIKEFNQEEIVIIGHSFGGKLGILLKKKYSDIKLITLAPSIIKNRFSIIKFLKIRVYKLGKLLNLRMPKIFQGSRDYCKTKGYLRRTFLNVFHYYLSYSDISKLNKFILIGFKKDQEVNLSRLKKIKKINPQVELYIFNGDHFGYYDSFIDICHIIKCLLMET